MKLTSDFSGQLKELNRELRTDYAIISHIVNQDYEVLTIESQFDVISPGDHFEIQNTYCNQVLDTNDTVMYAQVGIIKGMVRHPVYTAMQLEAYIGEPLRKDGRVVGTLNFSGYERKNPNFIQDEINKVKALARSIETALE
jgi:GAF domain-containing protein